MINKNFLFQNKKMSNLTWFGVGGLSKYYFQPSSEQDLVSFLKDNEQNLPIYPLGAGSNLIIRDKVFTKDKGYKMEFTKGGIEYLSKMASGYVSYFKGNDPLLFAKQVDIGKIHVMLVKSRKNCKSYNVVFVFIICFIICLELAN